LRIPLPPPHFPDNPEITEYFRQLHELVNGVSPEDSGNLDNENITDAAFTSFHDNVPGNHSSIIKATDPGDAIEFGETIDTTDAVVPYDANVAALINELKDEVNLLIASHNELIEQVNRITAALRSANIF